METLTLEQISNIAEIIGALLIVISLVYVAHQLHQNTEAIRVETANSLVNLTLNMVGDIVASREVAECWVKAGNDFSSLDEIDKQRAIMFEYRAIQAWHHYFQLRESGLMPDAQWKELSWFIENIGHNRQAVRETWKIFKGAYDQPFRDFLDQYLE